MPWRLDFGIQEPRERKRYFTCEHNTYLTESIWCQCCSESALCQRLVLNKIGKIRYWWKGNLCRSPRRYDIHSSHSRNPIYNDPPREYRGGPGCTWSKCTNNTLYYVHSNPSGDPLVLYDLRSQQSSSGSHIPPGECHLMQLQRNAYHVSLDPLQVTFLGHMSGHPCIGHFDYSHPGPILIREIMIGKSPKLKM